MKECVITVKKVYETEKTRTITEKSVKLSEEAITEICLLISMYEFEEHNYILRPLFEALWEM